MTVRLWFWLVTRHSWVPNLVPVAIAAGQTLPLSIGWQQPFYFAQSAGGQRSGRHIWAVLILSCLMQLQPDGLDVKDGALTGLVDDASSGECFSGCGQERLLWHLQHGSSGEAGLFTRHLDSPRGNVPSIKRQWYGLFWFSPDNHVTVV